MTDQEGHQGGQAAPAPAVPITPWSWQPATARPCDRCQALIVSQELGARCPSCGLVEGT